MKYIQITDKTSYDVVPYDQLTGVTEGDWCMYSLHNKKIKKISIINHSPQHNNKINLIIGRQTGATYLNNFYDSFYMQPEEILELTENYNDLYNIIAIGIRYYNNNKMKFNITIGYED